jgi:alpha-galactosidase
MNRPGLSRVSALLILLAPSAGGVPSSGEEIVKGRPMQSKSPYTSNVKILSRFTAKSFAPDGDLAKPVWKRAKWVHFNHDMAGYPTYPQAATSVASVWTERDVYFAFRCKYDTLNIYEGEDSAKERWELWERDVVEVFANPLPERVNHYYEFEVSPNNQWIDLEIDKDKDPFNDAGWNSGFEHATRIDEQNKIWTCEMRVPVKTMSVATIKTGDEWRINFYRADGPGDDSTRRFMSWSTIPEGRTFHAPTRFGIIRFVKQVSKDSSNWRGVIPPTAFRSHSSPARGGNP